MKNLLLFIAFTLCLGFVNAQTSTTGTTKPADKAQAAAPAKTAEAAKTMPAKTTETTKTMPAKTTETAKTMPAKTTETAKTMPAKKGKSMKTAEPAKTASSKKMEDTNTKEHVCTPACKDGKHVYAHGEKGHKCTAAEKRAMAKANKAKKMSPTTTPEVKKG